MNKLVSEKIEEVKKNGFNINIRNIFLKAWTLFVGTIFYSILVTFLYLLANWITKKFLGIFFTIPSFAFSELKSYKALYTFIGPGVIFLYFISLIVRSLSAPVIMSIFTIVKKFEKNENISFTDFFIHYKNGNFVTIFLSYLIIEIIYSFGLLFCFVPGYVFLMFCMFVMPLIVFGNFPVKQAIQSSFQILSKNLIQTALLFILLLIVYLILNKLIYGIGLVAGIPFILITVYVFYKDVIGFEKSYTNASEIGDVGRL